MFKNYNTDYINILDVFLARVNTYEIGNLENQFGETKFFQIGIKLKGTTEINYNGNKFVYSDNTALYLPCEKRLDVKYNKRYVLPGYGICVFFTSKKPLSEKPKLYDCKKTIIPHLFGDMLYFHKTDNRLEEKSVFYKILCELDKTQSGNSATPFQKKVTDYINGLTDANFHTENIMNLFNYSSDGFRHKFHKEFNMSPTKYVTLKKIEKAKELLAASNLTIAEISHRCSFEDCNYFSRVFKAKTGCTPSEFRKKSQKFL